MAPKSLRKTALWREQPSDRVQSGKHGRAGSRALCELARGQKRVWGASGENMVKGVYVAGKWRGQGTEKG